MGGVCGEYCGRERCAEGVGGEARGNDAIGETQTLDGRIILRVEIMKITVKVIFIISNIEYNTTGWNSMSLT
jgi:hypothetical protein